MKNESREKKEVSCEFATVDIFEGRALGAMLMNYFILNIRQKIT